MKVLMLTSTLPRYAGDAQANFVREQAEAWLAARPNDSLVVLAPHHSRAEKFEEHGRLAIRRYVYLRPHALQQLAYPAILANIRRNPSLAMQVPALLLSQYGTASRLASRERIDLVYAHWIMPQGLVAWRLKRSLGVPYILQNHSSDLSVFDRFGRVGRHVARAILREAAHFFCVNTAQRDYAAAFFEERDREIFLARCSVLPMGAVLPTDPVVEGGPAYDIATIGRLSRKKGINFLIEAGERLAERGICPSIAIAGDGEDRADLEALVKRSNVSFAGFLVGAKKDGFFRRSARFAFPARAAAGDVEGLPVALLEALCRGIPVLATRDTNIEMLPEWPEIRDLVVFVPDATDNAALDAGLERLLALGQTPSQTLAGIMARYRWANLIREYLAPIEAIIERVG